MDFTWDYHEKTVAVEPYWNLCVGSCHAATALREDYRQQLARCQRELGFRYVRFHGLFDDDMSVLRRMEKVGEEQWILSFTNVDSVYDFLLSINMKPFVELGFMPDCLRSSEATIFNYKGNTSKPNDYGRWDWMIGQFVGHLIERYGRSEVRQWFFEVWNEPDLGGPGTNNGFWAESKEEYFNLYRHTAKAIKKVDARLRVGGPATSFNKWIPEFLDFCKESGTPVDFVSTHHYPTDVVLGPMLEKFQKGGELSETMPECQKNFEEALWSQVDRGVLTGMDRRSLKEAKGLPVYYTEWNSLAGLPSDGPFGSSFILKTVMDSLGLVKAYSYWTFTDIFEEGGMPSKPFHGGYGLLTLQGIAKPAYRAFQMLNGLAGKKYEKNGACETVDVYAFCSEEYHLVQFLAVNHNSLYHPISEQEVKISLSGAEPVCATVKRLDESHGNALARWQEMGEPEYPDRGQLLELEASSWVREEPIALNGCEVTLTLPPMGAALVTMYL